VVSKEEDGRAKNGKNNIQSVDHGHGHRTLATGTLEDTRIPCQQDIEVTVEGRRVRKREKEKRRKGEKEKRRKGEEEERGTKITHP
jgi:hypothetical protein